MRAAAIATRLVLAIAAALVAAGCGGDDDDSGSDARAIDRSGYFTKEQSESLNPALGVYDTAFRQLDTTHEACSRTANRLFKAGRDSKVAVKCHLDNTAGVIAALEQVDAAFAKVDGSGFRDACTAQLNDTKAYVSEYLTAWKAVQVDWQTYADGKPVSEPLTQRHFNDAYAKGTEFVTTVIPELSKDCYTKADRDVAEKAAAEDEQDATADTKVDE